MTTSQAVAKILISSSITELREATAEAIEALSVETQLISRMTAAEEKIAALEAKP